MVGRMRKSMGAASMYPWKGGCLRKLGALFVGVLILRARLFGGYIRAAIFLETLMYWYACMNPASCMGSCIRPPDWLCNARAAF